MHPFSWCIWGWPPVFPGPIYLGLRFPDRGAQVVREGSVLPRPWAPHGRGPSILCPLPGGCMAGHAPVSSDMSRISPVIIAWAPMLMCRQNAAIMMLCSSWFLSP